MASKKEDVMDELEEKTRRMQLQSVGSARSPGLQLQVPNPFTEATGPDEADDEGMPTVSPRSSQGRVAAAPALPQPPRYKGVTMQDRRDFMKAYETYLAAVNALQTQWTGAFAMPVGACIESGTKRLIARWTFRKAPEQITEDEWIQYFKQANVASIVDYATVDAAMTKLKMDTSMPEPESRMMRLQADMTTILERFNLTDVAFANEQRRLVKYMVAALQP